MKTVIKIAWRNIWRNKLRSLTVIVSMVLGLFSGLFAVSMMLGLNDQRMAKNMLFLNKLMQLLQVLMVDLAQHILLDKLVKKELEKFSFWV